MVKGTIPAGRAESVCVVTTACDTRVSIVLPLLSEVWSRSGQRGATHQLGDCIIAIWFALAIVNVGFLLPCYLYPIAHWTLIDVCWVSTVLCTIHWVDFVHRGFLWCVVACHARIILDILFASTPYLNIFPRIADFAILVTVVIPVGLYLLSYFATNIIVCTSSSDSIVVIVGVSLLGFYRYSYRFDIGLVVVVHRSFLWCVVVSHALILYIVSTRCNRYMH